MRPQELAATACKFYIICNTAMICLHIFLAVAARLLRLLLWPLQNMRWSSEMWPGWMSLEMGQALELRRTAVEMMETGCPDESQGQWPPTAPGFVVLPMMETKDWCVKEGRTSSRKFQSSL